MPKRTPKILRNCQTCGAKMIKKPSVIAKGHGFFCSRSCAAYARPKQHGMTNSPTYFSWAAMLQRCKNPRCHKFPTYGAVGITVCEEWLKFDNFIADMGEKPKGYTIDRIDGTRGYSPDNCRWATPSQQQRNLRKNRLVTFQGKVMLLIDLAEQLGVKVATLAYRIDNWPEAHWGQKPWGGSRHKKLALSFPTLNQTL